jgi:hypothetical protein
MPEFTSPLDQHAFAKAGLVAKEGILTLALSPGQGEGPTQVLCNVAFVS